MIHFALQQNLGQKRDHLRLIEACQKVGCGFTELVHLPFCAQLPELPEIPTIFYGSINFSRSIWKSGKYKPGVWFDETNFDYRTWSAKWGDKCLNANAVFTTFEKLSELNYKPTDLLFIRPCADDKTFTGTVIEFGDAESRIASLTATPEDFKQLPIAVSEPVGISAEWRLYIVNGICVTASFYRKNLQLYSSADVPRDVIAFGEQIAAIWSPAPVYVLDIAESGDSLYVLEMGCFNNAGLYDADTDKLVYELNRIFG